VLTFACVTMATSAAVPFAACVGDDPAAPAPDPNAHPADSGSPNPLNDEGGKTDATAPNPGRCNRSSPFGEPQEVGNITNTALQESGARLSPDELTMYLSMVSDAGVWQIYSATRTDASADFGPPSQVPGVNSPTVHQHFPSVTGDGQFLYAATLVPAGN